MLLFRQMFVENDFMHHTSFFSHSAKILQGNSIPPNVIQKHYFLFISIISRLNIMNVSYKDTLLRLWNWLCHFSTTRSCHVFLGQTHRRYTVKINHQTCALGVTLALNRMSQLWLIYAAVEPLWQSVGELSDECVMLSDLPAWCYSGKSLHIFIFIGIITFTEMFTVEYLTCRHSRNVRSNLCIGW